MDQRLYIDIVTTLFFLILQIFYCKAKKKNFLKLEGLKTCKHIQLIFMKGDVDPKIYKSVDGINLPNSNKINLIRKASFMKWVASFYPLNVKKITRF